MRLSPEIGGTSETTLSRDQRRTEKKARKKVQQIEKI